MAIGTSKRYNDLSPSYQKFISTLDGVQVPRSIQVAIKSQKREKALNKELRALEKNGTF